MEEADTNRMLDHIYLADYLGAQSVLEDLAGFLGTLATKIVIQEGSSTRGCAMRIKCLSTSVSVSVLWQDMPRESYP